MKETRFNLIEIEDFLYLNSKLRFCNSELNVSELLDEMPTHLFTIGLDYGFDDTEVRDWIYLHLEGLK